MTHDETSITNINHQYQSRKPEIAKSCAVRVSAFFGLSRFRD